MTTAKHLGKGSQIPIFPDDGKLRFYLMRFCPYAERVHLVLAAKKVPFHKIFINLTEKPEWLPEKSPLEKVPALELPTEPNNPTITESLFIADYLDEKYPEQPLHSKNPLQKVQDRILIDRFGGVTSSLFKVFYESLDNAPGHFENAANGLDLYEQELKERNTPYFGGDKPGMVDYMIWPWFERYDMKKYLLGDEYEFEKERFPKLADWIGLMKDDPAVKVTYLDGETHAKFLRSRHSGNPDYDMAC